MKRRRLFNTTIAGACLAALLALAAGPGNHVPVSSPAFAESVYTLGNAEDRGVWQINVGDFVRISLSSQPGRLGFPVKWSDAKVSDGSVLKSDQGPFPQGTQGLFTAVSPGEAVITATGGLDCPATQACPAIAVGWTATIEIADSCAAGTC